jgi:hypothetical protein
MMRHTIRLIVIFALAILAAPLASDVQPAKRVWAFLLPPKRDTRNGVLRAKKGDAHESSYSTVRPRISHRDHAHRPGHSWDAK